MWLIIALIIIGALLLVAELILLPGLSIAGIGAFISYVIAGYLGFSNYGTTGGLIVIGVIIVVSVIGLALSLRAKTWRKLALNESIDGKSQISPENELKIGDRGTAITRLNPIGKVVVGEETYEARSLGDKYINEQTQVEVVGFDNFNIVVQAAPFIEISPKGSIDLNNTDEGKLTE